MTRCEVCWKDAPEVQAYDGKTTCVRCVKKHQYYVKKILDEELGL